VRLRVHTFRRKPGDPDAVPLLPWPLAAGLCAVGAAAASWIVVAGVMLVSWFTQPTMAMATALGFGTQVWLLSFGAPATIGSEHVTLMPLGLTALSLCFAVWAGRIAARQASLAHPDTRRRGLLAVAVAALFAAVYVAVVALTALACGFAASLPYACVGTAIVAVLGAAWSASAVFGVRLATFRLRVRRVVAGLSGGLLAAALVAAVALGAAVVTGWDRIQTIEVSLAAGGPGLFSLAVVALAWLPNTLAWALSWALGGGFTVGAGSAVSLTGVQAGMMPSIPVLGALPAPGVTPAPMVLWLLSGVLVGAVVAVASSAPRPGAELVERTLLAAAAGALTSGVIVGLAAASRGNLGTVRLVGLGPRLPDLLMMGSALIVLSAALVAAISWLFSHGAAHDR